MASLPLALSIHNFISKVGADAGFAAIIGLAILVLLLFAQARETASLRRRADEAEDQLHRLELYVDQLARRPRGAPEAAPGGAPMVTPPPAVAAPAFAGLGSPVAARAMNAPVGAMTVIPAAPAGVAAPALSAATRLIPAPDPISIRALRASEEAHANGSGVAVLESAPPVAAPSVAADGPPPSTPAGGASHPPAPGAGNGQQPPARVRLPGGGAPGGGAPAAERPLSMPPRRAGLTAEPSGSRVSRAAIAIATVIVVVIVVVVLLFVTGGSSTTTTSTPSAGASATTRAKTTTSRRTKAAAAIAPASITVAVLNGTSTTNLAHDVMAKLSADGYKQGAILTASDQTLTGTIVGYLPGDRAQAVVVAKSLKLGSASIQGVNASDRAVACGGATSACPAQVVVTVGSDLASYATTAASGSGANGVPASTTTSGA
ncbi:MAG: LytR C-terminal domain-containing protein [Solirubrobacteraceae bacterium]